MMQPTDQIESDDGHHRPPMRARDAWLLLALVCGTFALFAYAAWLVVLLVRVVLWL